MSDLAPYLPGFIAAYSILLVGALSPGPAVAMLTGLALERGRGTALQATLGIAVASACLNLATLAGVGLIVAQTAWAVTVLRFVGAAYLLWLAWSAFRKVAHPPRVTPRDMPPLSPARAFVMGLALQVTNPKAIFFWLAIATVGATKGGGPGIVVAFVAGAFVISFLAHAFWAVALSAERVRAGYLHLRRWIEGALGLFFTYAAFRLATARD